MLDAKAVRRQARAASRRRPRPPLATTTSADPRLDLSLKTLPAKKYRDALERVPGPDRHAVAPQGLRRPLAGAGLRGQRRRRQGRRDPPRHRRARRAPVPGRCRSRRPPRRSAPSPTCGASGASCRATATSPSSTAPGTAACWSSASRASAARPTGCAPTPRSTTSRSSWSTPAPSCVKFWLPISKDEQLRRFKEREKIAFKRFKITADDWRNRKKWDAYEPAVCDMVDRTSTDIAPWTLVEASTSTSRASRSYAPSSIAWSDSYRRWHHRSLPGSALAAGGHAQTIYPALLALRRRYRRAARRHSRRRFHRFRLAGR